MKHALLLFLSTNHLHAQHMTGDYIAVQRDFLDTPEGLEDFASFLQSVKCPTYLLTDLIEEDFRHEIVPHLRGRNRTALLKRKFEQFYRSTPFHQANLLRRQKTGRHDDEMRFSALTNPSLIAPWLNIMLAQQTPLAGIYSVPQISSPLIKDIPSNHLLLVSWEKFSGLRQTYFSEHHLQVSRLTPVHADLTFQDAVVKELARTYQYLKSLSLLPSGQTLEVLILCHRKDLNLLLEHLPKNADMHYDFADIEEFGKQHKINYSFTDSDARQIFLHQLATLPPKNHYANSSHTHYYDLLRLKHFLNITSGILLFAAIFWSAINYWQSSSDATETEELKAQAQQTLGKVQQLTLAFQNTLASAADMKAGVSTMRKLNQYSPSPLDIMVPISAALDRHPQIQVDELAWKMSAVEPVVNNTLADVPAQVITLKGHLVDFGYDYRAALKYLDSFQQELITQDYKITVLSKPFDTSASGSIVDQHESRTSTLDFSIKISRRTVAP
ncbi:MAG: hypothetical protein WAW75_07155 [Gallionella sp.]